MYVCIPVAELNMNDSESQPSKFAEAEKSSCTLICIAAMI